jgi:hypothetical protein
MGLTAAEYQKLECFSVVEHFTQNPTIRGSNPATSTGREKIVKKITSILLLLIGNKAFYGIHTFE